MRATTSRSTSISVMFAGVFTVLALCLGLGNRPLTALELSRFRGADGAQYKCDGNCNIFNGYLNICVPPRDGQGNAFSCYYCEKSDVVVHYTTDGAGCGTEKKYTTDVSHVTECGKRYSGTCTAVGVCTTKSDLTKCNDVPDVISQKKDET